MRAAIAAMEAARGCHVANVARLLGTACLWSGLVMSSAYGWQCSWDVDVPPLSVDPERMGGHLEWMFTPTCALGVG
eukprot:214894-Chlamydomonas_euryale.AAC.3